MTGHCMTGHCVTADSGRLEGFGVRGRTLPFGWVGWLWEMATQPCTAPPWAPAFAGVTKKKAGVTNSLTKGEGGHCMTGHCMAAGLGGVGCGRGGWWFAVAATSKGTAPPDSSSRGLLRMTFGQRRREEDWIPAFAGMTAKAKIYLRGNYG